MTHPSVALLRDVALDDRMQHHAPELRRLANAIEEGGLAFSEFAYVDLPRQFDGHELIQKARPSWLASVQAAPAVLVYLPLMFTWAGLAMASAAQGRLVARGVSPEGTSFLGLWQTGFQGELATPFRFGNVAGLTALALVLTLATVLLAGTLGRRWERDEAQASSASAKKLAAALRQADRYRSSWRSQFEHQSRADLSAAASEVKGLQTKAQTLMTKAVRAAESLDEQSQSLASAVIAVSETSTQVLAAGGRVQQASEAALATSGRMDVSLAALVDLIAETEAQVTANATAAQQRVERLADELTRLLEDYSQGVSAAALQAIGEMAREGSGRLLEALGAVEQQLLAVSEVVRAGMATSLSVVDASGQLLTRMDRWEQSARMSTDSLLSRVDELATQTAAVASELRAASASMREPAAMGGTG